MPGILLALLLSGGAPALAQNAVDLEAVATVGLGQGDPSLSFLGNTAGHIDVALVCGSMRYTLSAAISPGSRSSLPLTGLSAGSHACSGQLTLRTPDGGEGQLPLKLAVAVLPPLRLHAPEASLDLASRSLVLRSDRPLKALQVDVFGGQAGERVGGAGLDLSGATEVPVTWDGSGEALRIDLIATDIHGISGKLTLLPWSYQIPHEDLIFDSGKAEVTPGEAPKLEAAWGHIAETLRKYGEIVQMELFVAGYTDTVGDAARNQALSQARAKAIATWFQERGFQGAIWVQGFGESVLAVGTPDETEEPANRRSVYVLSAQAPRPSPDLPKAAWTRLQ